MKKFQGQLLPWKLKVNVPFEAYNVLQFAMICKINYISSLHYNSSTISMILRFYVGTKFHKILHILCTMNADNPTISCVNTSIAR